MKLDLNLQENCSSYLFIISSPAMRRLSIQAVRTEPTWQSQKGLYARETGGGEGGGVGGMKKKQKHDCTSTVIGDTAINMQN